MKKENFSPKCFLLPLSISVLFFFPSFQRDNSQQPGQIVQVYSDSIYRADSLRILEIYNDCWHYYGSEDYQGLLENSKLIEPICKKHLTYRQDSFLLEYQIAGRDAVSQAKALMGNYEEGLEEMIDNCQTYIETFGENNVYMTQTYVGIGQLYGLMGDHEMSIKYNQKGLHVANQIFQKNHYFFGNLYSNIGGHYKNLEDYDQSLYYYKKAYDNLTSLKLPNAPYVLLNLADIYRLNKDYAQAFNCLNTYVKFCDNPGNDKKICLVGYYEVLGQIKIDLALYSEATHYFEKIKEIVTKSNLKSDYPKNQYFINAHQSLGQIAIKEGKYDKAINEFENAINLLESTYGKSNPILINTQNNIGYALFLKKSFKKALHSYQKSINILIPNIPASDIFLNPNINQVIISQNLLESISQKAIIAKHWYLEEKTPQSKSLSLSSFELTDKIIDKMLTNFQTPKSKSFLLNKSAFIFEEAIDFSFQLYEETNDQKYLKLAFYYLEKSKSTLLLAGLQESKAKHYSGVEDNLLEAERQLKKKQSLYEKLIFEEEIKENPDSIKLGFWYNTTFSLKTSYDSILSVIQTQHPEYYQLKFDLSVADIDDVQNQLDKNSALVNYMLGDTSLFIFTVTKNEVFYHQQKLDSSFLKNLADFRYSLFNYQPGRKNEVEKKEEFMHFSENAQMLYQYLLAPVLSKTNARDLIIIPDGQLGYIPFQVLLTEDPGAGVFNYRSLPYLFIDHTIRYEYSASMLLQEYPKHKTDNPYAGFGPEYEGDELLASRSSADSLLVTQLFSETVRAGLSSLKYNQPEVETASEAIGGKAFIGKDALESQFKLEAPNSRILHLAMHSLTNDEAPLYSQLVFSKEPDTLEDGLLHAFELYNMQLNADLAVLSACNTGAGKLQKGEGIMSLSRAFKYAGCPNIVMSLWKADDLSTKQIMTNFFNNLKDGKGKNVALQEARKTYLFEQADDGMTHPYYWATFVLIGDDEAIKMNLSSWKYWLYCAGALVFIYLGYFIIKKKKMAQFTKIK